MIPMLEVYNLMCLMSTDKLYIEEESGFATPEAEWNDPGEEADDAGRHVI